MAMNSKLKLCGEKVWLGGYDSLGKYIKLDTEDIYKFNNKYYVLSDTEDNGLRQNVFSGMYVIDNTLILCSKDYSAKFTINQHKIYWQCQYKNTRDYGNDLWNSIASIVPKCDIRKGEFRQNRIENVGNVVCQRYHNGYYILMYVSSKGNGGYAQLMYGNNTLYERVTYERIYSSNRSNHTNSRYGYLCIGKPLRQGDKWIAVDFEYGRIILESDTEIRLINKQEKYVLECNGKEYDLIRR
jgi:hypothetical protein